jgi:hypothetical protein
LKTPLEGSGFDSRENVIQNVMAQLHTIPEALPTIEGLLG